MSHIDKLWDKLSDSQVYAALDLAQGYHQLRVKDDDVHKTAFKTQYGFFFFVMPFGLSSAPSTFQRLMSRVLKSGENTFVLVYLYDVFDNLVYLHDVVIIFSSNLDDHLKHFDKVLSLLNQHQLSLCLSKYCIGKSELNNLGHTLLSFHGLKPS